MILPLKPCIFCKQSTILSCFFTATIVCIFIGLLAEECKGVQLTQECVENIECLVQQYMQISDESDRTTELSIKIANSSVGVLLWCPMSRFSKALRCPVHGNDLSYSRWVYKQSDNPRMIYGLTKNDILVQRYYYCGGSDHRSKHKILSTDQDILLQLSANERSAMKFKLRHKCGWTNDLSDFIFTQVSYGATFLDIVSQVERFRVERLGHRYSIDSVLQNELSLTSLSGLFQQQFQENELFRFPSRDIVETIFLETFIERRNFYEWFMDDLTANSISMDHTFKVSKNIGIVRQIDQKWTQQYSSLFIVLNEQGLVVTWSFTSTEKFEEISQLLISLRDRMASKGITVKQAYLDNCCKWAKLLEDVFGPGLEVKLDIFHGLQRITRTIPKRSKMSSSCSADLRLVVRNRSDVGATRIAETPSPKVINENMDIFVSKWNNGSPSTPWTDETTKEVNNLKVSDSAFERRPDHHLS